VWRSDGAVTISRSCFSVHLYGLAFVAPSFLNLILTSWWSHRGVRWCGTAWGGTVLAAFRHMPLHASTIGIRAASWLQWIAWLLPPTYVFEGIAPWDAGNVRAGLMAEAFGLNAVFFAIAVFVFLKLVESAGV